MISTNFRYKGHLYNISFYPCGNMARVKKDDGLFERDIKYDSKLTVKKFLHSLEKMRFN